MAVNPVCFGHAQVGAQPATSKVAGPTFGCQASAPAQDTFTRSNAGADVRFGYGNSKQNLAVVKGSFEKEAARLDRAGKLPKGMTRAEFVENKIAEWKKRDRRK